MPKYEVRTIEWLPPYFRQTCRTRGPMWELASTHPSYSEAVTACDAVNAAAWADLECNPFLYGGESLFFQSTFPPGPFCDYLEDRGIDLPASGPDTDNAGWVAWYKLGRRKRSSLKSRRKRFTPVQMLALREVMNLVRFAEVVEVADVATKGYLVQELFWSWDDYSDSPACRPDPEGGLFVAVYRSRSKADGRCAELNAARRGQGDHGGMTLFDTEGRKGAVEPFQTPITETLFYEVVEVDLDVRAGVS